MGVSNKSLHSFLSAHDPWGTPFSYTIEDIHGVAATATVTVTVTAAPVVTNDPPVAVDDTATIQQGDGELKLPIWVLANDSDPDGDQFSLVAVGSAVNGTVELAGSLALLDVDEDDEENAARFHDFLLYTPNEGFTGEDTFTYTIEDTEGHQATGTVTVTVTAAEPPNIVPEVDNLHLVEDTGTPDDKITTDARIAGQITHADGGVDLVGVEYRIGDGEEPTGEVYTGYDGTGEFEVDLTYAGLVEGSNTIWFRSTEWDSDSSDYVYSDWVHFDFTFELPPPVDLSPGEGTFDFDLTDYRAEESGAYYENSQAPTFEQSTTSSGSGSASGSGSGSSSGSGSASGSGFGAFDPFALSASSNFSGIPDVESAFALMSSAYQVHPQGTVNLQDGDSINDTQTTTDAEGGQWVVTQVISWNLTLDAVENTDETWTIDQALTSTYTITTDYTSADAAVTSVLIQSGVYNYTLTASGDATSAQIQFDSHREDEFDYDQTETQSVTTSGGLTATTTTVLSDTSSRTADAHGTGTKSTLVDGRVQLDLLLDFDATGSWDTTNDYDLITVNSPEGDVFVNHAHTEDWTYSFDRSETLFDSVPDSWSHQETYTHSGNLSDTKTWQEWANSAESVNGVDTTTATHYEHSQSHGGNFQFDAEWSDSRTSAGVETAFISRDAFDKVSHRTVDITTTVTDITDNAVADRTVLTHTETTDTTDSQKLHTDAEIRQFDQFSDGTTESSSDWVEDDQTLYAVTQREIVDVGLTDISSGGWSVTADVNTDTTTVNASDESRVQIWTDKRDKTGVETSGYADTTVDITTNDIDATLFIDQTVIDGTGTGTTVTNDFVSTRTLNSSTSNTLTANTTDGSYYSGATTVPFRGSGSVNVNDSSSDFVR